VASISDEEAKKRVQEAVWTWTGRFVVLAFVFGAGFFSGYLAWGAGEMGARNLRPLRETLEAKVTEINNKRVDCESKLSVTGQRLEECQKKAAAAAAVAPAPQQ
jgi:hypothetical protein